MENNFDKDTEIAEQSEPATEKVDRADEETVEAPAKNNKFPLWIIPLCAAVVIAIAMIIIIPNLGGNDPEPPEITYKDYVVTIVDTLGQPMDNIVVKFTTPDGEVKTRVTEQGIASLKNVAEGEYKVNLDLGVSSAIVETTDYTLTKDLTEIVIIARDADNSLDIYGDIADGSYGSVIMVGEYNISCNADEPLYYVFNARQTGVYKVSISSDSDATVGYYGMPMFVQANHCGDGPYDGKSFEVIIQDITTPYVFGIKSASNASVKLVIERTGAAPFDPNFAPWINIGAPDNLTPCDTAGKELEDIDIADSDLEVSLGDDGYYYTNDGRLVYIRITSVTGYGRYESQTFIPVLNGSLALLAGGVNEDIGITIGGYVYDDDGNFVNKYCFNDLIIAYMDMVDETYGVVPMTEDLANCIKIHGTSNGWYNSESNGYIFEGILVEPELSWLFLCMVEA